MSQNAPEYKDADVLVFMNSKERQLNRFFHISGNQGYVHHMYSASPGSKASFFF